MNAEESFMIRLACVLLLSSVMAFAQAPAQNQGSANQAPAQSNGPDQPYYDGKPQPAPLTQPVTPGPDAVTVPAGTKIPLRLENSISTKSARPGDGVYLRTIFPVAVNNTMAIPVGTYVQGVITEVKRPGRVSGRAEVLFRFTTLIYPDGYTFNIPGALNNVPGAENSTVKDKEGTVQANGTKGRDTATIAESTGGGAAVGAIADGAKGAGIGAGAGGMVGLATVLLTRGNDVRLEQGTTVEMVLQRALVLDDVNSHTRYYSGPPLTQSSRRFTIPDRNRRTDDHPVVLTPAPPERY
jgi:hypothetical protein